MKKILLYPGAFNPPHFGHIVAIEIALKNQQFDELWIVPSGNRDDKTISISYEDRRKLGEIFVEYLKSKFSIPVELVITELDDKSGRTTQEILKEIKSQPDLEIVQLIGSDGFINIQPTVDASEKFIVIKRPGAILDKDSYDNAIILDETSPEISSTRIREMVKQKNQDYKNLLPKEVVEYIENNRLYI